MIRHVVGIVAAYAVFAAGVASADTDITVDFAGTYVRPYDLSIYGAFHGDFVIDTTVGTVVSASISDAYATYNVACAGSDCALASPPQNIRVEDDHFLVTQTSLIGITTLTAATETGTYNGILLTDRGDLITHSAVDPNCGSYTCAMTAIQYSVPSTTPITAPEINPSSAASAMTLLLGGLAVMRGRRRSESDRRLLA